MDSILVLEKLQMETNKAICRPITQSFKDQANKFLDDTLECDKQLNVITNTLSEANEFFYPGRHHFQNI
jgi:hypothetical protein